MTRILVDVETGEIKEEPFTAEELKRIQDSLKVSESETKIAPVSPAQAKLALDDAGMLDAVEAAVAAHPVKAVSIWYNNANLWERGNPYIQALGMELGLTDEQIDDLFEAASLK